MPPKFAPSGPLALVMKKVMFGNCGGGGCALAVVLHTKAAANANRAFLDISTPNPIHNRRGEGRRSRRRQPSVSSQNCVQWGRPEERNNRGAARRCRDRTRPDSAWTLLWPDRRLRSRAVLCFSRRTG